MFCHYLITTNHYNKKAYIDEVDLRSIKQLLESYNVYFDDYVFEWHGKYRQLHMHAIVKFSGRYKPLTKFESFRIHWAPARSAQDLKEFRRYLTKQVYNRWMQEQVLSFNQYSKFRFVDTQDIQDIRDPGQARQGTHNHNTPISQTTLPILPLTGNLSVE